MRHHESRKGRSGFTLIELLVVVAIIALLISILLPSLARARELAKRTTCAANMSGIGKGLHTYASDGNQGMPVAAGAVAAAVDTCSVNYIKQIGTQNVDTGNVSPLPTAMSTVRNLWILIRSGGSTPGSFICPSSEDQKNDLDNPQDVWDFGTKYPSTVNAYKEVSYGYQVPYGQYGRPSAEGDQRAVLSADKGPWGAFSKGETSTTGDPAECTLASTASPDDWRKYNSPNHGGLNDGEGQNVLYADSHADWANKPCAGPAYDNIYTAWTSAAGGPADRVQGKSPTQGKPSAAPLANTDGLIYP